MHRLPWAPFSAPLIPSALITSMAFCIPVAVWKDTLVPLDCALISAMRCTSTMERTITCEFPSDRTFASNFQLRALPRPEYCPYSLQKSLWLRRIAGTKGFFLLRCLFYFLLFTFVFSRDTPNAPRTGPPASPDGSPPRISRSAPSCLRSRFSALLRPNSHG